MPRKGTGSKQGGRRAGAPGAAYPSRSDLNGTQPVTVMPGQEYGKRQDQVEAQQVVPLPQQGSGAPVGPAGAGPGAPPPLPGELTPLSAPTQQPGEPITTGIDSGPGAGSDALLTNPQAYARGQLQRIAEESSDPFLVALARRAGGR